MKRDEYSDVSSEFIVAQDSRGKEHGSANLIVFATDESVFAEGRYALLVKGSTRTAYVAFVEGVLLAQLEITTLVVVSKLMVTNRIIETLTNAITLRNKHLCLRRVEITVSADLLWPYQGSGLPSYH